MAPSSWVTANTLRIDRNRPIHLEIFSFKKTPHHCLWRKSSPRRWYFQLESKKGQTHHALSQLRSQRWTNQHWKLHTQRTRRFHIPLCFSSPRGLHKTGDYSTAADSNGLWTAKSPKTEWPSQLERTPGQQNSRSMQITSQISENFITNSEEISIQWIKSHQDDKTSYTKVNINVDKLETQQNTRGTSHNPNQGWQQHALPPPKSPSW